MLCEIFPSECHTESFERMHPIIIQKRLPHEMPHEMHVHAQYTFHVHIYTHTSSVHLNLAAF